MVDEQNHANVTITRIPQHLDVMQRRVPFQFYVILIYALVGVVLLWPLFGPGSPPGVDTPTFLHFAWVTEQALLGNLEDPLIDPFWCGGIPYLQAYPPLAYGTVGLISAVTPICLEIVFHGVIFASYVALGVAVYQMARNYLIGRWMAVWAGLLMLTSYQMFVTIGLFGRFTTLVALVFGFILLDGAMKRARTGRALGAGVLFAACLLSHHVTALALAIGLTPWSLLMLYRSTNRVQLVRVLAVESGRLIAFAGWGLVGFITHTVGVGFEREVPGIWQFEVTGVVARAIGTSLIGVETYPSYLGLVFAPLAWKRDLLDPQPSIIHCIGCYSWAAALVRN